jgi:putative ABC transport system permease protein
MLELVLANLRTRPFRTLISVLGVGLGVVLVVLFTGLATGMTNDMAKRANNWKAEIVFTRPGAMGMMSSNLSVSTGYVDKLKEIDGVESVTPVGKYIAANAKGRFGLKQIDGIDWEPFAAMNDMKIERGRAMVASDEVMLDETQMRDDKLNLGDKISLFGEKPFKVVGVYSPPSGSRTKMTLAAMQDVLTSERKCTYILVKLKNGADVDTVAKAIDQALPGNKINLTRDLILNASDRLPGLKPFLRVLVGLGAFVSTIFVLLSMYTTITERKKEIGILKSMGASKSFIVTVIESEALMIGILGIMAGFIVSFASSFLIQRFFELQFEFSWDWILIAIAIAILGSLVGALYPAWRASDIDPVLVLTND